jgi:Pyruvate/2-oxoacid:ferredoxin oxidoreductase gamma subunit
VKIALTDEEQRQADAWRAAGYTKQRIERNILALREAMKEARCTEPLKTAVPDAARVAKAS